MWANHRKLSFSPPSFSLTSSPDCYQVTVPAPRLWIFCFIGSVCLSQRAWLAGWAYAVAREISQSEQGGSFPSVSRQVSRAVDVLAGEWESRSGRGGYRVKWSMWLCVCESGRMCVCACASWVCMFASACSFCPASCFLMQHRTVSPGLLGDLVMFFFLPVLAGNENQLLCCCHRSGEVCFPSTFIPGTSPSTVTVETRATPTLFPSMSPYFNDLSLLSFFNPLHSAYLPTL